MSLSYKKRIATRFMLATAIIIAVVFTTVYFIVQQTVYQNLDVDLSFEANKHITEIEITDTNVHFSNKDEWEENEHREVQVNPVFIQITDASGQLMDKSPNLKENQLPFKSNEIYEGHFNAKLNNRVIRQIQIPIKINGNIKAYILAAMSLDSTLMVLKNLQLTLLILFPIILIALFFISSFLAGKSIMPVVSVINTTNQITKNNLNERVELPQNKDILFDLSSSINSLLDRVENAIDREKQFTSDASHELRTPLSVLRGTLEILIRKQRSQEEYENKIQYSLIEIDRMSKTIDQLLEIARFDIDTDLNSNTSTSLITLINDILVRKNVNLVEKKLKIEFDTSHCDHTVNVNSFYTNLIIENVIDNAIKYSKNNSEIKIELFLKENDVICKVSDFGIGIKKEDLELIFNPFFRSDYLKHKHIKGSGLGLSIAKKSAKAIESDILIASKYGKGTDVYINFKEILRVT